MIQGGTVTAMTINKGILLGFVPSNDSQVIIFSKQSHTKYYAYITSNFISITRASKHARKFSNDSFFPAPTFKILAKYWNAVRMLQNYY